MDAGIVDTINRHVVQAITTQLDVVDSELRAEMLLPDSLKPWHEAPLADSLMSDLPDSNGDRAWLVGFLAARTPNVAFDGDPAGCDWDNLFSHFRTEILARRDPKNPHAGMAETLPGVVV